MEIAEDGVPAGTLVVHGLEPLRVMSDPLRMRLVELLRGAPSTVRQLADSLQVSPRSLYYHINLLERHGLVCVIQTRVVSGIIEKTYRATAHIFLFADLDPTGSSSESNELDTAIDSLFRSTREEMAASRRAGRLNPGTKSFLESGYQLEWNLLNLTVDEAATLAERMEALIEEYRGRGKASGAAPSRETFRLLFTLFRSYPRGEGAFEER